MDNGIIIREMGLEHMSLMMRNMKGSGSMIYIMALDCWNLKMEEFIKEIGFKIKKMAKENIYLLMGIYIMDNGY